MGLPRKLKDMGVFHNGNTWRGIANAVTLPKLARKLEEWRGAGMDSAVKLDMGGEPMELEFTTGEPMRDALSDYAGTLGGTMLRFAGSYEADDTGLLMAVEVTVRGRYEEIDLGEAKPGEGGEFMGTIAVSYYRLEIDGREAIEIDPLNMVLRVDGVDRLAARRAIIA